MENYINKTYISNNEDETIKIAYNFASKLISKDIVVLTGNLGAGKTKFMYGIAKFFGVENFVSSPTFTIVNEYPVLQGNDTTNCKDNIEKINHFDVYKLNDYIDFCDSIGTDYFNDSSSVSIIEWGEIIKEILPKNTIYIKMEIDSEHVEKRIISFSRKDV